MSLLVNFETVRKMTIAAAFAGVLAGCAADGAIVHSSSAEAARAADDCLPEYRALQVATEAFVAMTGQFPGSQRDLVSADMMREEVADFDLVIGDNDYMVVSVGSRCAKFDPDATSAAPGPTAAVGLPDCDVERRTIETAWEAYNAQNGVPPLSEADLVPNYMFVDSVGFDLVGSTIVPVPGLCG